jgi:hypothetical protein
MLLQTVFTYWSEGKFAASADHLTRPLAVEYLGARRPAQEAGVKGARIHVERAVAADYEQVLREIAACLFSAVKARAA